MSFTSATPCQLSKVAREQVPRGPCAWVEELPRYCTCWLSSSAGGVVMPPNNLATIGSGVEVRLSSIQGGGLGLWTTRSFKRNQLITEYCGPIISHKQALKRRRRNRHSHIRVLNSQFQYIDGIRDPLPGMGGASFANDARTSALNNAAFVCRHDSKLGRDRVYLKATQDLPPGTEVFVGYGKTYWRHHREQPASLPEQQAGVQQAEQSALQQNVGQRLQQVGMVLQQHPEQVQQQAAAEPRTSQHWHAGKGQPLVLAAAAQLQQQPQQPWRRPLEQHQQKLLHTGGPGTSSTAPQQPLSHQPMAIALPAAAAAGRLSSTVTGPVGHVVMQPVQQPQQQQQQQLLPVCTQPQGLPHALPAVAGGAFAAHGPLNVAQALPAQLRPAHHVAAAAATSHQLAA